jgi:rhodanese-related sulfurtransferase
MEARQKMTVAKVTLHDVKARLDRGSPTLFIDARDKEGWQNADAKIPGALRMTIENIDAEFDKIPQGQAIIIYGNGVKEAESFKLAEELGKRGLKDIFVLDGGFYSWLAAGFPLESHTGHRGNAEGDEWQGLISGEKV